jgi:hypothetical protein
MHEELFLNLLKQYEQGGLSLDRVITDPRFKTMPLAEKVRLLKEHGHTIHNGSKMDSKFWKDLAMGAMGTAIMVAEPAMHAVSDLKRGYQYGEAVRASHDEGKSYDGEIPSIDFKTYKSIAISAAGAGIAAPKFYQALQARNNMRMVKRLLHEQPGSNTQEDAINVIARS